MFQMILLCRLKIKNHMYICYNLLIILAECFWIKNNILFFKQDHITILDLHKMLVIYAFSFANLWYQFTMCFVTVVFLLLIAYLDSFEDWFISLIMNNHHTMFTNVPFCFHITQTRAYHLIFILPLLII